MLASHGTIASSDDIRALPKLGYGVQTDSGGTYRIVSYDDTGAATVGYAIAENTGLLVRFVQTGWTRRSGTVRCQVTAATDPGAPNDLVVFNGETFGGRINERIAVSRWDKPLRERTA